MKLSIRAQAVIGIGMIEVVMLVVLLYSVFHFIDSSTTDEVERRAQSIARIFAATAADDVLSLDLGSLQSFVDAAARTPGTAFARVTDYNGHLLAEAGNPDALRHSFQRSREAAGLSDLYMAKSTIVKAGLNYGTVEIGLDLREQLQGIEQVKRRSLMIAGLEVLAAALFSIAAGYYLVRRLKHIRRVLGRVNNGEYSQRVNDSQLDEVSEVASEIDRLTQRLAWEKANSERRIAELEELNGLLQKRLSEQRRLR
ncbi:HAMP domain-containing protein [Marinobacter salsuginis]|uniref:HAMP domain-containing protein n=1 Tax=Marinobacter salsuginis TaxID=418719 RepID=UPI001C9729D3|nr:HAMP domain-containing protein [Marinobacter salsuginis]MBY6072017.1 HAMP domain-containing protein [Marinobacter salsuginis]